VFRGFINDLKSAAGSVVAKYAARASVAVPFIIALGFATAGITLMLIDRFGHRNAYFMVASGFAAIGFLAAMIVRTKEHVEVVAEEQAMQADTATDGVADADQLPLALLGGLFSGPIGSTSILSLMRVLGRNLPLVLMLIAMGVLLWPTSNGNTVTEENAEDAVDPGFPPPNGTFPPSGSHQTAYP
jgi:hypothetical protein